MARLTSNNDCQIFTAAQGTYDAAHEHEGNLTKEVEALKEQVEALQTSAAAAAQETASLEGRLAEAAATNTAQAEAFLKQSEDLQVRGTKLPVAIIPSLASR